MILSLRTNVLCTWCRRHEWLKLSLSECLRQKSIGNWLEQPTATLNAANIPVNYRWTLEHKTNSGCLANVLSVNTDAARRCLQNRWIFLIGDSSARYFFSGLVHLVNGTGTSRTHPYYPSHRPCHFNCPENNADCCRRHNKGQEGFGPDSVISDEANLPPILQSYGIIKEYYDHKTRITFSFKKFARDKSVSFATMTSPFHQPDILLWETGAWDIYHGDWNASAWNASSVVQENIDFIDGIQAQYKGPVVWLTVPACDEAYKGMSIELNQLMEVPLQERGIFTLDRDATLNNMPDELQSLCDGFHPGHVLTDEHVQWLLTAVCPRS